MHKTITLSSAALEHLRENIQQAPVGTLGVRVGLKDAGCSGFAYTMDFTDEHNPEDEIFEQDGIKIFVTTNDLKFLNGTEIDLVQEGVNSVLEFNNPNVVHQCGCGESFQFKDETDNEETHNM